MDNEPGDEPAPGVPAAAHKVRAASGADRDSREAVSYLTWPESDDYVAIMDVLEQSVTEMTAAAVTAAVTMAGRRLPAPTVEDRLDALKKIGAVSARADTSRARRYSELLARNWLYTASPIGRRVQRFYRQVLAAAPAMREIPIQSLNLLVTNLETLALAITEAPDPGPAAAAHVNTTATIFISHDDLDSSLVGAEDVLAGLADRFDLDDANTAELKGLLVEYAKRVVNLLDTGSARAADALAVLAPHFPTLAAATVNASEASDLIAAGALTASRGGRVEDWTGLYDWCHPGRGRAYRFSLRLVNALPGMHANLRRLHTSSGTATSRARALALARAVLDRQIGTQIFQAAVGDHSWRKLYGAADEDDTGRNPTWRGGPKVPVPELLRTRGRSGPRGKGAAPRDNTAARAEVEQARKLRHAAHQAAIDEVLASVPGQSLTEPAARAALAALMAAARTSPQGPRRTATFGGLACTIVRVNDVNGLVAAATWRVLLPGRMPVFHLPGRRPNAAQIAALNSHPATADTDHTIPIAVIAAGDTKEGAA